MQLSYSYFVQLQLLSTFRQSKEKHNGNSNIAFLYLEICKTVHPLNPVFRTKIFKLSDSKKVYFEL